MVKFQSMNQMLGKLEEIIKHTKHEVTFISPYIKPDPKLFEKLNMLEREGKKIRIVYGKDSMNPEVLDKLRALKSCSLFYYEDLHAKCYFNEDEMIIGSLNLLLSSEKNREMGVFLDNKVETDKEAFEDARKEAEEIILNADPDQLKNPKDLVPEKIIPEAKKKSSSKEQGFCIRCQSEIKYNPDKPLCKEDYVSWNKYADPKYQEKYCHRCGKLYSTSVEKPLCLQCFKELK
jgi:phosphatidylserine/phosphatidylglycerophosphate/cardiolipin synthase-like enzyme